MPTSQREAEPIQTNPVPGHLRSPDDELRADLILLLVSADFLASDCCYEIEMKRALEREASGEGCVVPILVRNCQWKQSTFVELQVLRRDARRVRLRPDRDSAWSNIAEGLEKRIPGVGER